MDNKIVKPSILPGFMELLPSEQILFNEMVDTIRKNYEKYGFLPIDTPIIEKSEVLLAKGGGETEKQIYRFTKGDTDMSMRFDLTVPLARYVAQYFSQLNFPYRRYHIGKVYRGERNQKGRFREFYQCDIDIIGNGELSIVNDAEMPSIIYSTFRDLGFESFTIKINNRKLLNGFFEGLGVQDKAGTLRTIDKLEKIGIKSVIEELTKIGLEKSTVDRIINFIQIKGTNDEIISQVSDIGIENEQFNTGISELREVVGYIKAFGVPNKNYTIDLTIARGLDYYTGTIYETFLDEYPSLGSICSGGRYDNLAEYYTKQKLPGVGISIGLTRLFYQLREANIISPKASTLTKVIVIPVEENIDYCINVANKLRVHGIISEVYYEAAKVGKKIGYADKLGIPYVILIGSEEINTGNLTFKNLKSGEQYNLSIEDIISKLS